MAGYVVSAVNGITVPNAVGDPTFYPNGAVVPLAKLLPGNYQWMVLNGLITETESGFSGGGGGSVAWGGITGTLSAQTDLQSALNAKLSLTGGVLTGALSGTTGSFTGAVDSGTSIGIASGPTWVNDSGKWRTTSNVRIDGTTLFMIDNGGSIKFGGTSDVSLTRTGSAAASFTGTLSFLDKVNTAASATGGAGLSIPHGTAPLAPSDGDVWSTTAGLYMRVNGATVGPFGTGGGGGTWGSITGTLSSQTDLQSALDAKLNLTGGTLTGNLRLNANLGINTDPTTPLHLVSGNNILRFANGGSNTTPQLSLGTSGGKSVGLLAGTGGTAFIYQNDATFNICVDTKANIENGTSSGGTALFTMGSTGNVSLTGNLTIGKTIPSLVFNNTGTNGKEGALLTGTSGMAFIYDDTGSFYIQSSPSANILGADPSAGATTRLEINSSGNATLSGDLTISKANAYMTINGTSGAGGSLYLLGVAGSARSVQFYTGGTSRWDIRTNSAAESGSNAGSDFSINRYTDAGAFIDAPLTITRQTGFAHFSSAVNVNGALGLSGSQHTIKNATPTILNFVKGSRFGYSSGYRTVVLGDTGTANFTSVAIGEDVSDITSGAFSGNGSEVIFRNAAEFMTPNSGRTGFLKPMKWDSSGNTTLLGLTTAGDVSLTAGNLSVNPGYISLGGSTLGDRLMLYGAKDGATSYGLGIESGTLYYRANVTHRWYLGHVADSGTSEKMRLDVNGLYPNYLNLVNTADTATAATHYYVETGTDGYVRPKTLANVKTEIVTSAAMTSAVSEIGYLSGVTSSIQTQLNSKSDTSHTHNYAGSSSAGGAADSVANSFTVKFDSGTTEGTDLYTFNGSASKTVNIVAGSNITLTESAGQVTIASTGGGGGGAWGSITGTLSSQTDLQTALDEQTLGKVMDIW